MRTMIMSEILPLHLIRCSVCCKITEVLPKAYPTSPQARVPIFEFFGTYSMFIANGFELVETLPPYYTRLIKKL